MSKIKDQITEKTWTKGFYARNKKDGVCQNSDGFAFCLMGWVIKLYNGKDYVRVRDKITAELGGASATSWNDRRERTFEDVKNLVEKLDI